MAAQQKQLPSPLQELFTEVGQYRESRDFTALMHFLRDMPKHAPYNAMLMHIQRPGASLALSRLQWAEYGRRIKAGALPLIILYPFGPVTFVYDISDTEAHRSDALDHEAILRKLQNPFQAEGKLPKGFLEKLARNLPRDGAALTYSKLGANLAGYIRPLEEKERYYQPWRADLSLKVWYEIVINDGLDDPSRLATIAHELGHLYCGHLGTPSEKWWPNCRSGLSKEISEIEAECVAWIVCSRQGIDPGSAKYLSGYMTGEAKELPNIDLDCILKAAGLVESMLKNTLPLRQNSTPLGVD